jgi:hypothetical protein
LASLRPFEREELTAHTTEGPMLLAPTIPKR